jgi:replicative DNA helicase
MKYTFGNKEDIIEELLNTEPGIESGIAALDDKIYGFRPGELISIGGRASMGKSSLARTMALNMSKEHNVCFISLEDIGWLKTYMICNLGKVNADRALNNKMNEEEIHRMKVGQEELSKRHIGYEERGGLTPEDVRVYILEQQEKEEVGCVFVDYLQRLRGDTRYNTRLDEVSNISHKLKDIAMECEVPIVALTQLNRNPDTRENKRPTMIDIRECGDIENDANRVLLLYRQSYYDIRISKFGEDNGEAEIIVAKNRGGWTGTVKCGFLAEVMQFCDDPDYISEKEAGDEF